MALPKGYETPDGLRLLEILKITPIEELSEKWPHLSDSDYAAVGMLIVLFSYIELNLRRLVEACEHAGLLQEPYKGRVKRLHIGEVEKVAQSMFSWPEPFLNGLKKMVTLRELRNLVAHFSIRRFPSDNAFVFIAKSDKDFRDQFGREPEPGGLLTVILEAPSFFRAVAEVAQLQEVLARKTAETIAQWAPLIEANLNMPKDS
ncbi:MAG: hypothetical protein QOH32_3518 [Bradyrhizobium sp.]|jgi:hypothetical protein|nr:hypothetical protein [Bradyrhizobium sp.]